MTRSNTAWWILCSGWSLLLGLAALWPGVGRATTAPPALAAGEHHSLAVLGDGTVRAWGGNAQGQLGTGTLVGSTLPVPVRDLTGAGELGGCVTVAAGGQHSLALTADGGVLAWGDNRDGQLGFDPAEAERSSLPRAVPGLTEIVAIAAGQEHSLALGGDGLVRAWGRGDNGRLGIGSQQDRFQPTLVDDLTDVVAIAAGPEHSLALRADGTVWAWGSNEHGELGQGRSGGFELRPVQVRAPQGSGYLTGVTAISVGGEHSLARTADGGVWSWGFNGPEGRLGIDLIGNHRTRPVRVLGPGGDGLSTGMVALAAGGSHSLMLGEDGLLYAWGDDRYEQLGAGPTRPPHRSPVPLPVRDPATGEPLTGIVAIVAGTDHCLLLREDGQLCAWGRNDEGQLGNGDPTSRRYTCILDTTDRRVDLAILPGDLAFSRDPAQVGEEVFITVTVRNLGLLEQADVPVAIRADGALLGRVTVPVLPAGATAAVTLTTSFVTTGDQVIAAIVDPDQAIVESNEENNEAQALLRVNWLDVGLGPGDLTATPDPARVGAPTTLRAVIRNYGEELAREVLVRFLADGALLGEARLAELAPGAAQPVTLFAILPRGRHVLTVQVDPEDTLRESREDNNVASLTLPVELLDLAVAAAELSCSPDPARVGEPVTLTALIRNPGDVLLEQVAVRVAINGVPRDPIVLPLVAPGDAVPVQVITSFAEPGPRTFTVTVDPADAFAEADETNNEAERTLEVVAVTGPDLAVSAADLVFSQNPLQLGEPVCLTATIHNLGTVAVDDVPVRLTANGELLALFLVPTLAAGGHDQVEHCTAFATDGARIIGVHVDPEDLIDERDEENNEASRVLMVGEGATARIVVVAQVADPVPEKCRTTVTGRAWYELEQDGQVNREQPVQGARVTLPGFSPQTDQPYTRLDGTFSLPIETPEQEGSYPLFVVVFDSSLRGQEEYALNVSGPCEQPELYLVACELELPGELVPGTNVPVGVLVHNRRRGAAAARLVLTDLGPDGSTELQSLTVAVPPLGQTAAQLTYSTAGLPPDTFRIIQVAVRDVQPPDTDLSNNYATRLIRLGDPTGRACRVATAQRVSTPVCADEGGGSTATYQYELTAADDGTLTFPLQAGRPRARVVETDQTGAGQPTRRDGSGAVGFSVPAAPGFYHLTYWAEDCGTAEAGCVTPDPLRFEVLPKCHEPPPTEQRDVAVYSHGIVFTDGTVRPRQVEVGDTFRIEATLEHRLGETVGVAAVPVTIQDLFLLANGELHAEPLFHTTVLLTGYGTRTVATPPYQALVPGPHLFKVTLDYPDGRPSNNGATRELQVGPYAPLLTVHVLEPQVGQLVGQFPFTIRLEVQDETERVLGPDELSLLQLYLLDPTTGYSHLFEEVVQSGVLQQGEFSDGQFRLLWAPAIPPFGDQVRLHVLALGLNQGTGEDTHLFRVAGAASQLSESPDPDRVNLSSIVRLPTGQPLPLRLLAYTSEEGGVPPGYPFLSAIAWDPDGDDLVGLQLQVAAEPTFTGALLWALPADPARPYEPICPTPSGQRTWSLPYRGQPLQFEQTYYWRIRFFDAQGEGGPWSDAEPWSAQGGDAFVILADDQPPALTEVAPGLPDTDPPVLTGVPADLTVACTEPLPPVAPVRAANDRGELPVTFQQTQAGVCPTRIAQSWRAANGCLVETTATRLITMVDAVPPELTGVPADQALASCAEVPSPAPVRLADSCDPAPRLTFGERWAAACPPTLYRTWSGEDVCGNRVQAQQTLTVAADAPPPELVGVPADLLVRDCTELPPPAQVSVAGGCQAELFLDEEPWGPCSSVRRTWTALDLCEAVTASQTITVEQPDATPPTFGFVPPDVTAECGAALTPAALGTAEAADNCPGAVTISHADVRLPGASGGQYLITRSWTATDPCGNTSVAVQTITVRDTTPPVLTVPPDRTLELGDSTLPAATGWARATDNSGEAPTVGYTDLEEPDGCLLVIARSWQATDGAGNRSVGVQRLSVLDTRGPGLTCPAGALVDLATLPPPDPELVVATDPSGVAAVEHEGDLELGGAGTCDDPRRLLRSYRATDACGNEAECVQLLTVAELDPPVLTVPGDRIVECGDPLTPAATGQASATDAGSQLTLTYSDTSLGLCPATLSRTWSATDGCGNQARAVQQLTIRDTVAPALLPPPDLDLTEEGGATHPDETGWPTVQDGCDPEPAVSYQDTVSTQGCLQVITRRWQATDRCGNQAEALQTLTLQTADLLLRGADLTLSATLVQVNEPVTISATIRNQGCETLDRVTVRFFEGATALGDREIFDLAAAGRATVTLTTSFLTPGSRTIRALVDPDDQLGELSESNNEASRLLHVGTLQSPSPAPRTLGLAVPLRIEAEDYDLGGPGVAYWDSTVGNQGGQYRADDVDIYQSTGEQSPAVLLHNGTEWLEYTVQVEEGGVYDLALRAANPCGATRQVQIQVDGIPATTAVVPYLSADAQLYATLLATGLTLTAGEHVIRLQADGHYLYLNWFELGPPGFFVPVAQAPYNGPHRVGPEQVCRIEAEDFDVGGPAVAYWSYYLGNAGGRYRVDEHVDIYASTPEQSSVVYLRNYYEWLEYTVTVTESGRYDLLLRAANASGAAQPMRIYVDDQLRATIDVPYLGADWSIYASLLAPELELTAGEHVIRLRPGNSHLYVNWFELGRPGFFLPVVQAPYNGPHVIAPEQVRRIEAEDFDVGGPAVAYFSYYLGNAGGQYRTDEHVDIHAVAAEHGYTVLLRNYLEWLEYTVLVTEDGVYDLVARVANTSRNPQPLRVYVDDQLAATLTVPYLGVDTSIHASLLAAGIELTAGEHLLRLQPANQDLYVNWFEFGAPGFFVPVAQGPFHGPHVVDPEGVCRVEVEDFDVGGPGVAYFDYYVGNAGGQYRTDEHVDIYTSTVEQSPFVPLASYLEWLEYTVIVTETGVYDLTVRVANANGNTQPLQTLVDGQPVGSLEVPYLGGEWTLYSTLLLPGLELSAGEHVLRLQPGSNQLYLNWFELGPAGFFTPVAQAPYPAPHVVSPDQVCRVEAEDFDQGGPSVAYFDHHTGNAGGVYRTDEHVDIYYSAVEQSHYVAIYYYLEWLEYTVHVTEGGTYDLAVRVANASGNAQPLELSVDGQLATTLTVPYLGGESSIYATLLVPGLELAAGDHVLRLHPGNGPLHVNWFELGGPGFFTPVAQAPFNGPHQVGPDGICRVEAEDFDRGGPGVAYLDYDQGNRGGLYRPDEHVDIYRSEAEQSHYVNGYYHHEWLEYTVTVAAEADYDLRVRLATTSGISPLELSVDGVLVTTLTVPSVAGSLAVFGSAVATGIRLTPGDHVLRFHSGAGQFYLNWFELAPGGSFLADGQAPYPGPHLVTPEGTCRIEAEDYDGGGPGVAYWDYDLGNTGGSPYRTDEHVDLVFAAAEQSHAVALYNSAEWTEYTLTVQEDGRYDLALRVANAYGNGQSLVLTLDGAPLTSVAIPYLAADWKIYQTFLAPDLLLTAGDHVLRVRSGSSTLYLNWLELGRPGTLVPPTRAPYNGPHLVSLAGVCRIEAEDFDVGGPGLAYWDYNFGNAGGQYRLDEHVDVYFVAAEQSHTVSLYNSNEWLEYTVTVAEEGDYELLVRVANAQGEGQSLRLAVDGQLLATVAVPYLGAEWRIYQTFRATGLHLTPGPHVLRLSSGNSTLEVNWLELGPPGFAVPVAQAAFPGPHLVAPGAVCRIEAEDFDVGGPGLAYWDYNFGNAGGQYRLDEHVDLYPSATEGGIYASLHNSNEWLEYTVTVAEAGSYELQLRAANAYANNQALTLAVDGQPWTTVPITYQPSWSSFATYVVPNLPLPAGDHVLRLKPSGGTLAVNWFELR